jgi:hypothetical protein
MVLATVRPALLAFGLYYWFCANSFAQKVLAIGVTVAIGYESKFGTLSRTGLKVR